jgi:hypothetical protein
MDGVRRPRRNFANPAERWVEEYVEEVVEQVMGQTAEAAGQPGHPRRRRSLRAWLPLAYDELRVLAFPPREKAARTLANRLAAARPTRITRDAF